MIGTSVRGFALLLIRSAALATLVASAAACDAAQPVPHSAAAAPLELTGRVVDAAHILNSDAQAALETRLAAIERDTLAEVVVVSTPDLNGMSIADYGLQLGRGWGIGDAKRNDGVLLIVAPNEREVRIEVGYGLEASLSDKFCATVIATDILPLFRKNDLPGGTLAGVRALERKLRQTSEPRA